MKNSEDLNNYYEMINRYIDDYIEKWKISPKKLKKYLNINRLDNFLERKGINVPNIKRVVYDIIDDRIALEKESVKKFESFNYTNTELNISELLLKGIEKANLQHEKILADYCDTSLSQISILDSSKHLFKYQDVNFLVFTKDEIVLLKENIKAWLLSKILSKSISLDYKNSSLKIELSKIIDADKLEDIISTEELDIQKMITDILNCEESHIFKENYIGLKNAR